MKKKWIAYIAFITLLVFAIMVPVAGAYQTYSDGCVNCHGDFRTNTYNSLAAAKAYNPAWPGTTLALHNGHANSATGTPPGMLNGNCNACHFGSSRTPVYTYQSSGTAPFNQSCSGCHDGPGLRAHHVNSGADTCYDCHNDPTPDAENVPRPVYTAALGTTSGTTRVNDACNPAAAGFEGRIKDVTNLGLDNDGNLKYDQNDPACAAAAPIIGVSPTTLSFGNQAVNITSTAKTVTISNTGTAILSITGITNSNTTDYILTAPSIPFNVAAGGSQTLTISFTPGSTGAKSATVSMTSNAGNATVSATGTGIAPVLSLSPTTLTFASQTIGSTSAAKTVTISNTGTGTLNVTGITSSNSEFAVSPSTVSPIAPGGSATLNVTFTPGAPSGSKSSTISILSDGGNATVSGTGTGVTAGALSVSPATLPFASQTVGTTSATQTVTISNTGGAALTVNSITNGNTIDFVLSAPATPLTINDGASQIFTVAFKPAASGARSSTITVASTAGNATVSATGTGVTIVTQPVLSVSPSSLTFANVKVSTTVSQTVTISNTGNAPLNITNITKAGSAAFSFSPASFASIAAGANATLTVTYSPAVVGTDTGSITITSDGGNATVNLAGSAVQQPSPGTSDVALVNLSVPSKVTVKVGQTLDLHVLAGATTTNNEVDATVTLNAASDSRVKASIDHYSLTEEIKSDATDPKKFEFEAKISCTKKGTWPVTWTAKINAASNSNTNNDTLKGTTQVTCSVGNSGRVSSHK